MKTGRGKGERIMCFLNLHRWEVVKDTGVHLYLRCKRCGNREIRRVMFSGHRPIDENWLKTGKWSTPLDRFDPPIGGAAT